MQKREFERYLKKKKSKKFLALIIVVIPLFFLSFLKFSFTGNVVADNIGNQGSSFLAIFLLALFLVFAVIAAFNFVSEGRKNRRFDRHSSILINSLKKGNEA